MVLYQTAAIFYIDWIDGRNGLITHFDYEILQTSQCMTFCSFGEDGKSTTGKQSSVEAIWVHISIDKISFSGFKSTTLCLTNRFFLTSFAEWSAARLSTILPQVLPLTDWSIPVSYHLQVMYYDHHIYRWSLTLPQWVCYSLYDFWISDR